jgi:hypothetical protein
MTAMGRWGDSNRIDFALAGHRSTSKRCDFVAECGKIIADIPAVRRCYPAVLFAVNRRCFRAKNREQSIACEG